jgi:cystathionine gamma-lyase
MKFAGSGFSTRAIHAGQDPDPATGATIVPIYQTSTYTQEAPGQHKGYEYSRTGNPTRTALEECVAALEGAGYGLAFASGLAATTAVMSLLSPGDHVVAGDDLYGGTYRLFDRVLPRSGGLDFTYADTTNAASVEEALRPETKLLWIETPTNPMLTLSDIARLSEMAHERGVFVAVDNTFASPYFQKPLARCQAHSTPGSCSAASRPSQSECASTRRTPSPSPSSCRPILRSTRCTIPACLTIPSTSWRRGR